VSLRQLCLTTIGAAIVIACVLLVVPRTDSDADAFASAAAATPPVASNVLSALPTPDAEPTPQPVLATRSVADLLQQFLTTQAGPADRPAAWSGHIRSVTVGLQTATIRTDLGDSPDDQAMAQQIADVAARFADNGVGQRVQPPDIEVLGASQQSLATHAVTRMAHKPGPR
jgi:hypothetical protein